MDITAIGTKIAIQSLAVPLGWVFTQSAQDGTFWEVDTTTIGEVAVGLNCNQISWSKPSVITLRISVVPNSVDDSVLGMIATYNRAQGAAANLDSIQISKIEPNGVKSIYGNFKLIEIPPDNTANAEGNFATKTYTFAGVRQVNAGSVVSTIYSIASNLS